MARSRQRGDGARRRRQGVVAAAVVAAGILGLGSAAFGETYELPGAVIGTNGSDAGSNTYPTSLLAVSQGGCAHGWVAIAIGESNRHCGGYESPGFWGDGEANGNTLAIGLFGAESAGTVAVSDEGDARTCDSPGGLFAGTNCLLLTPPTAISAGGSTNSVTSVSATGDSYTRAGTAVSGTGTAHGDCDQYNQATTAVSGTHNSSGCTAVSGLGASQARGCTGDVWQDFLGGFAVSGTGNASGCTAVSGTGDASGGTSISLLGTVEELLP